MKAPASSRLLIVTVFLMFGLSAANSFAQDDVFEESVSISSPFRLDVDTGSGSIEVRAGSGDEVIVSGKIRVNRRFWGGNRGDRDEIIQAIKDNPPIEVSNGRLKVGRIDDRDLRKKVSISYDIVVPATTEVVADTGSGSVTVTDISAPVNVDTGSGSVRLENITGPVKADTGSGPITIDGRQEGDWRIDTGSGGIRIR
jgi:DUF4097 and DUF4098 domain-containing protein YvlB